MGRLSLVSSSTVERRLKIKNYKNLHNLLFVRARYFFTTEIVSVILSYIIVYNRLLNMLLGVKKQEVH